VHAALPEAEDGRNEGVLVCAKLLCEIGPIDRFQRDAQRRRLLAASLQARVRAQILPLPLLSQWIAAAFWRKHDAQPGWRQLEQDAKRDRESTAAAEDRARLGEICLRLS
jgi:hypothetical protein